MRIDLVMDALAEAVENVAGLRVYPFPPDSVQTPAAVVGYPADELDYQFTFGHATARATFPVWIVVSKAYDRIGRGLLAPYLTAKGATSIKDAIDGPLFIETDPGPPPVATLVADSACVTDVRVETVTIAGVDWLAARFNVDIVAGEPAEEEE